LHCTSLLNNEKDRFEISFHKILDFKIKRTKKYDQKIKISAVFMTGPTDWSSHLDPTRMQLTYRPDRQPVSNSISGPSCNAFASGANGKGFNSCPVKLGTEFLLANVEANGIFQKMRQKFRHMSNTGSVNYTFS